MQGINLSKICNNVMNFFDSVVEKADHKAYFVKRKSKLTAKLFFNTLITACLADPYVTLEGMCLLLKRQKVKISKQGMHQRFNTDAVSFMKTLFQESLTYFCMKQKEVFGLLSIFSSILITDSTGIELPPHLCWLFKGCGGVSSEAGLKLQTTFEYLTGQIKSITATDGRRSDQSFDEHVKFVEKGALYLQDQGYFKFSSFAKIIENGSYFISRCPPTIAMFDAQSKKISLIDELRNVGSQFEKMVWIGGKKKLLVRVVASQLSDADAEKRLRKLRKDHKRRGTTPSHKALEMAKWSIYITNVDLGMLTGAQVHLVYTLRWQIELLFKLFKSESGIDKINGRNINRILCEIYAKLICVVQLLYFCFPVRWQEKLNEISFRKAYKVLRLQSNEFFMALKSSYLLSKFLKSFFEDLIVFSAKDKSRNKRRTTYQKIIDSSKQMDLYEKQAA